ncbi:hypothetical protein SynPROS71_01966 [Synechococcus sp. PROS-7-1]|nr:hypothetical protein SynPROS71_01966 [Synechococcus sp. PROS-7-1]
MMGISRHSSREVSRVFYGLETGRSGELGPNQKAPANRQGSTF